MKQEEKVFPVSWRFYVVIFLILFIVAGLITRLVHLSILHQSFLKNQGDIRTVRLVTQPSFRGMITDRDGYPFAVSTATYSIWVNPQEFMIKDSYVKTLSDLLNIPKKQLVKDIHKHKNKKREFFYLKRGVTSELVQEIKKANLLGVYSQQTYKRFYPEGEITSHIIGFTDIDDRGQEGLELAYNNWLTGSPGKKMVVKDRLGRVISEVQQLQKQDPGHDLTLSINRRIQYVAYRALLEGVKNNLATSGSVVVLDVKTGEILAMVNQPTFNPNDRSHALADTFRNRAVTDVFEPGSTIKAFSVASALDSGVYQSNSIIDTSPGWIRIGNNIVKDEHRKGPMTLEQILQISSNVGVTKMILSIPPNQLWSLLHRVGFGDETGINFPGERTGFLIKQDRWRPFTLATLAFGYGLSVTPLQLAEAYSVIANQGIKVPLSLLKVTEPPQGQRVMDPKVAKEMLTLLESVVAKGGTGELAHISGYRVAGKTGTAIKVGDHGYQKHHYTSSFVGIAPASNPRLVVAVVIHDPSGKEYYGGIVSGPIFKKIMEESLRILTIPPDVV